MSDFLTAVLGFGAALGVSFALTPAVIGLSWRFLALDRPDARKHHLAPIPRVGGVSVMAAFATGIGVYLWRSGYEGTLLNAVRYHWIGWIAAIAVLFLCGLLDDLRGLPASVKLVVQLGAGLFVYLSGFSIDYVTLPWFGLVRMGALSLPVTLLWIVTVTNAINLIDGLDGLAAGIGFLITGTVAAIAFHQGTFPVGVIALALSGGLLGFLPYNFSPARIFLGDSGSQFLGFTLAVISIRGLQKSATLVAVLAPILVLGLPILDTILVVVRRGWRIRHETRSPGGSRGLRAAVARAHGLFEADREHIHHNLLELGLSHRKAVLVLYVASAIFCAAAFGLVVLRDPTVAILVAVSVTLLTTLVKILAVRRRAYSPPKVLATLTDAADQDSLRSSSDAEKGPSIVSSDLLGFGAVAGGNVGSIPPAAQPPAGTAETGPGTRGEC